MGLLDLKDFQDLLDMQTERTRHFEETAESTETPLKKFVKHQREEELKRITESKYKKDDLPDDYFFSALGELVLKDD